MPHDWWVFNLGILPTANAFPMPGSDRPTHGVAMPTAPSIVLTPSLTLLFAFAVSVMIVNLSAAQPLAAPVATDLRIPASLAGLVATLPQLGYAMGMLLLVPLADLWENRRLAVGTLAICACMLVTAGIAPNAAVFLGAAFVAGTTSCAIQILVPLAASMASPERRGSAVGSVMSGLMVGILFSRPLASLIAGHFGWRAFYALLGSLDAFVAVILWIYLPQRRPAAGHSYGTLILSLWQLWKHDAVLRRYSLSAASVMAAFSAFWTGVAMLLVQAPFALTANGAAMFALAGVAGTVVAPLAGRAGDRGHGVIGMRVAHVVLLAGILLAGLAGAGWSGFDIGGHRLVALGLLVAAAIIIDAGVVGDQTLGRRAINMLAPEARSRFNGLFVGVFFVGGGAGAAGASIAWAWAGWTGVCGLCLGFASLAFIGDALARKLPD